jgi:hypothetical protein
MGIESGGVLVGLHDSGNPVSFLDNVKKLRESLESYLSSDFEDPNLLRDLKLNLQRVLAQHQKIINRPTKLSPEEIKAEAMLKEMVGRGTEEKKRGILAEMFSPLVKIFKSRDDNYFDKIFAQILSNAKFNIPVIDRAHVEISTAAGPKTLIDPSSRPERKAFDERSK